MSESEFLGLQYNRLECKVIYHEVPQSIDLPSIGNVSQFDIFLHLRQRTLLISNLTQE